MLKGWKRIDGYIVRETGTTVYIKKANGAKFSEAEAERFRKAEARARMGHYWYAIAIPKRKGRICK